MRTPTRRDANAQSLPEPAEPRRLRNAARFVIAVYAALLLAAPLIVRYGPGPDVVALGPPALADVATAAPCAPEAKHACPPARDDFD